MGRIADAFRAEIQEWNKRWDEQHVQVQRLLDECLELNDELKQSLEEEV